MKAQNDLKAIILAIHNDHEEHGKLVGSIRDRNGKPLLSWRVAILPYIEQGELFREVHRNEPWDSPHNLTLLGKMPEVYRSIGAKTPQPFWTFTQLVAGPGTAFERDGLTLNEIKNADGVSNTVFVLEAGEAVPWTKPDEWQYDPNEPLPPVGGVFRHSGWWARRRGQHDGTNDAFGDGSVRILPRDTPEQYWRAIVTRDGGEKVERP